MNFSELIQYKSLQLKDQLSRSFDEDLNESVIAKMAKDPEFSQQMRNICALIHIESYEEITDLCKQLGLSKRRFVEAALLKALDEAKVIFASVDPLSARQE